MATTYGNTWSISSGGALAGQNVVGTPISIGSRGYLLGTVLPGDPSLTPTVIRPLITWQQGPVFTPLVNLDSDKANLGRIHGEKIALRLEAGTADTLITIPHTLGRKPQALRIVNLVMETASDLGFYRLYTDRDWNERDIDVRFRFDDCDVLLEVT